MTLKKTLLGACLAIACTGAANAQMQLSFQNIAGGFTGDGGQAQAASLHGAQSAVMDGAGNLYVSQTWANRIRKITPAGVITTVVGGSLGFGGDGGPASSALINQPSGLAIDASGNLYFSDGGNGRVRRIAPNGTITTVAGNGSRLDGGDGGQATAAGLATPWGLAIDKLGNLYIGDVSAHRVRKVTPAGVISTFAGTGYAGDLGDNGPASLAQVNTPYGLGVDASNNLYIADYVNSSVRRVTPAGTISMYQDGVYPNDVEVDAAGNVYMQNDCSIIKRTGTTMVTYGTIMSPDGNLWCETPPSPDGTLATAAYFGIPDGMTFDTAGNLLFVDSDNSRIAKINTADGTITTHAGTPLTIPNGTPAANALFSLTSGLSVGKDGSIALFDNHYAYRLRKLAGGTVSTVAGTGKRSYSDCWSAPCTGMDQTMYSNAGLATAANGAIYLADRMLPGVVRLETNGTVTPITSPYGNTNVDNVPATALRVNPRSIALDEVGNLYIADYSYSRIRKVTPGGIVSTFAGGGAGGLGDNGPALNASVNTPTLVAADSAGNVYVASPDGTLRKVGLDRYIRRVAGHTYNENPNDVGGYSGEGGLAVNAGLGLVQGLAAHPTGVYFVSEGFVRRIRPDGRIETLKNVPGGYARAIAAKNGFLYITTSAGRVLRAVLPRKNIASYNGDGRTDLMWRDSIGRNSIWLGADSATPQAIATLSTEHKLVAQGDFDGDGKADLAWRNTVTGANTVWRGGSASSQLVVAAMPDQNWTVAGAGDFNGDGKADLFWRNKVTGQNQLWYSANQATRLNLTTVADLNNVVAGIGDFDGDGRADILWRNKVTGGNGIWVGGISTITRPMTAVTNAQWKVVAIGDFNADQVSDVVWRNVASGANVIWLAADSTRQMTVTGVNNLQWTIAGAGDYDNDGTADLLWRNPVTGVTTIWKNANSATQRTLPTVPSTWSVVPYEAQP